MVRNKCTFIGSIITAVFLVVAWVFSAQAQTFVSELTLVDADGKRVGRVIDTGAEKRFVDMVLQVGGPERLVKLFVTKAGFSTDSGNLLYALIFESTDCTGTPYFEPSDHPSLYERAALGPPGQTVYVVDQNAPPRGINVMSGLDSLSGDCFPTSYSAQDVRPASALIDLFAAFTPPFKLTAESPVCGDCDGDGTVTANEISRVVSNVFGRGQ